MARGLMATILEPRDLVHRGNMSLENEYDILAKASPTYSWHRRVDFIQIKYI